MQYGFWSIVPPLVTIVLALVLKNVFISLLIGIFLACFILCGFNPIVGLNDTFYGLVNTFASSGNTIVLLSMLLIGALIHMIERSGGIEGFVDIMVKKKGIIRSKRAAASVPANPRSLSVSSSLSTCRTVQACHTAIVLAP